MPVSAFIFLISLFAETNRLPFDMAEGEADLVGGFHTEYGSLKWGLFFVAEYSHMLIGSAVFVLLFLGGWNPLPWVPLADLAAWLHVASYPIILGLLSIGIFLGKVLFFIFVFMWVRWTVPRFRYDQVMTLGWQKLLPLAIGNLIVYALAIAAIQLHLAGWPWWRWPRAAPRPWRSPSTCPAKSFSPERHALRRRTQSLSPSRNVSTFRRSSAA